MDTPMGCRRASSYFSNFVLDAWLYLINERSLVVTGNEIFAPESITAIVG